MMRPVPYLVAEYPAVNYSVYMLFTNNNHYETLILKDNSRTLFYSKINKKDYKKKKKLKS